MEHADLLVSGFLVISVVLCVNAFYAQVDSIGLGNDDVTADENGRFL